MNVSEAVERLKHALIPEWVGQETFHVWGPDLTALLNSHEALRLAGLPFAETAKHIPAETPDNRSALNRLAAGQWRALSLAVEDAGR